MKYKKKTNFEEFLFESFSNGIMSRELRLSDSEVNIIRETIPNLKIEALTDLPKNIMHHPNEEKKWYRVNVM